LQQAGMPDTQRLNIWSAFTEDYFLRYRSEEIAWHSRILAGAGAGVADGLVDVRKQAGGDGVEAVLYTPRTRRTFAHTSAALDELGMTIVDARVVPIKSGYSLDTFIFMELDRHIEVDDLRLRRIRDALARILTRPDDGIAKVTRRAPRQVRMFPTRTTVEFDNDVTNRRTIMELVAGDRPGLLSTVGKVFMDLGVEIETAKVMTIGERAEDVFYVVNKTGEPLDPEQREALRERLTAELDTQD
jgi:[protein-PII] uridylyltransferase